MSAPDARPWFARWFDGTYAALYAHRDDTEAEAATARLLEPLGLAGKRVLDLGCGAGRWARAVERRGAQAVGLDLSSELLRLAREAGLRRLVRADMRALPLADASFDLVLCMFTTFGYFESPEDDRRALFEMGRVLHAGGELVLDHLNAERARLELVPVTVRRVGRFEVIERRTLDANEDRILKEIELCCGEERHTYREEVRLWDVEALSRACGEAGLEVIAVWGDYEGGTFASESPRAILRARRRA